MTRILTQTGLDITFYPLTLLAIVTALRDDGSVLDADAVKALPDENQEEKKGDARGVTGLEQKKSRSFILIFGCKSGMGIDAKS